MTTRRRTEKKAPTVSNQSLACQPPLEQLVQLPKRFGSFLALLLVIGVILSIGGCANPASVAVPSTITLNIPTITPQPETQYTQSKAGLEISVAPVTHTAVIKEHVRVQSTNPPVWVFFVGGVNDVYVEQTTYQTAKVEPGQLRFLVKINNKMPRVFYGKGTVVQFNAGGRLLAVDQSGYNMFLGAIVPPRQEQQIEIIGPPLSELTQPKGIIGIFLYDVVTNQDDSGKVTEKQNYEWYFDYQMEGKTVEIRSVRTKRFMPMAEFQEIMRRQQMEQMPQYPGRYPPGYMPPMMVPQPQ